MKKMITLFALLAVIASCSKDDDTPASEIKFPTDYLIEGSPWVFSDVEILRVNYNPNNLTVAETKLKFKNTYEGLTFDFRDNGTGSATVPNDGSYSFNWTISPNFGTITLTGNAPAVFTDVIITENSFLFSDADYCVEDGQGDDVCADIRFTFE